MKIMQIVTPLLVAVTFTVLATGTARAQAIVSQEASDGSIELSNISSADSQEPVKAEPIAGEAATLSTQEPANAEAAAKDPRELHRDLVMLQPEAVSAGTTAASRRYKKVNLASYRENMMGATLEAAPKPQGGSAATP
ncbi:MAG: hypothetical protein WCG50_17220 [Rhodoferax sp.]|uniref:hypothetical protein n=1 Tax=Rhodoferax sp. TaxID=50421 RepID=UPI0030159DE9